MTQTDLSCATNGANLRALNPADSDPLRARGNNDDDDDDANASDEQLGAQRVHSTKTNGGSSSFAHLSVSDDSGQTSLYPTLKATAARTATTASATQTSHSSSGVFGTSTHTTISSGLAATFSTLGVGAGGPTSMSSAGMLMPLSNAATAGASGASASGGGGGGGGRRSSALSTPSLPPSSSPSPPPSMPSALLAPVTAFGTSVSVTALPAQAPSLPSMPTTPVDMSHPLDSMKSISTLDVDDDAVVVDDEEEEDEAAETAVAIGATANHSGGEHNRSYYRSVSPMTRDVTAAPGATYAYNSSSLQRPPQHGREEEERTGHHLQEEDGGEGEEVVEPTTGRTNVTALTAATIATIATTETLEASTSSRSSTASALSKDPTTATTAATEKSPLTEPTTQSDDASGRTGSGSDPGAAHHRQEPGAGGEATSDGDETATPDVKKAAALSGFKRVTDATTTSSTATDEEGSTSGSKAQAPRQQKEDTSDVVLDMDATQEAPEAPDVPAAPVSDSPSRSGFDLSSSSSRAAPADVVADIEAGKQQPAVTASTGKLIGSNDPGVGGAAGELKYAARHSDDDTISDESEDQAVSAGRMTKGRSLFFGLLIGFALWWLGFVTLRSKSVRQSVHLRLYCIGIGVQAGLQTIFAILFFTLVRI